MSVTLSVPLTVQNATPLLTIGTPEIEVEPDVRTPLRSRPNQPELDVSHHVRASSAHSYDFQSTNRRLSRLASKRVSFARDTQFKPTSRTSRTITLGDIQFRLDQNQNAAASSKNPVTSKQKKRNCNRYLRKHLQFVGHQISVFTITTFSTFLISCIACQVTL